MVRQFSVYWVNLDPTIGAEIKKKRPCVVISPDELNAHLSTVIIVPITSTSKEYPWRIKCSLKGKECYLVTEQLRTVDKLRLSEKYSELDSDIILRLKQILKEMFS